MEPERDPVFDDLEQAITAWNFAAEGALPQVQGDLAEIHAKLAALRGQFAERSKLSLPLLLARAQLDAVSQDPDRRAQQVARLTAAVRRLGESLGAFEIEVQTLAAQEQRTERAASAFREAFSAITGEQARTTPQAPPDAKARETMLERRLEESRAQATALQNELAAYRKRLAEAEAASAAAAAAPAPAPVAVPQAVQEELARLRTEVASLRQHAAEAAETPLEIEGDPYLRIRRHSRDEEGKRRKLGQILVDAGILSQQELELALAEQRSSWHRHLGAILVQLGFVTEETIARTLAAQLDLPYVEVRFESFTSDVLTLISPNLAVLHTCIPLQVSGGELTVVMANPLDIVALDDLGMTTGLTPRPVVGAASEIKSAIRKHYRHTAGA